MPRKPYDQPAREHGALQYEVHKTRLGYMVRQPSGAVYHVTPKGWRRVPDGVVEEAMQIAENERSDAA